MMDQRAHSHRDSIRIGLNAAKHVICRHISRQRVYTDCFPGFSGSILPLADSPLSHTPPPPARYPVAPPAVPLAARFAAAHSAAARASARRLLAKPPTATLPLAVAGLAAADGLLAHSAGR